MNIDLVDTTTHKIQDALTHARHRMGAAVGMVLTLVVVTDEATQYDAIRAAGEVAREHPCRVLAVIRRHGRGTSRLDAEVRVGESGPGETVLLRMYGELAEHADSVVDPLLMPDTPVAIWWPGTAPEIPAKDSLGRLAQRRVTDAAASTDPPGQLAHLAKAYKPGDTDFAWTRLTSWRALLAATLDQPYEGTMTGGSVGGEEGNPSAELLVAWLADRLEVPMERHTTDGPGLTEVRLTTTSGDIAVTRPDGRVATLSRPDQPDRQVALHRRSTAELLAEELRRLDPDDVYQETVSRYARGQSTVAAGT